ncbi:alpha/beta fold hydrolase [Dongia deserti]|uniref:alpha/beta fold hydrolase n=1 Tax=Dongia deserti TaxID=2268030 RepID=UPI0013C508BC|nr:alpha/beta fold hydrolase [Dongia deserti]
MPAILFMAGLGDDSSMFFPLKDTELAARYRLLGLDLPGFGNTPPLKTATTLEALARVVRAVAEEEGARIVVAHSVASIIASLATRPAPSPIETILSLEGNLTAEDAYFSGTAADFASAHEFRQAFLTRLDRLVEDHPIIARYRSVVAKADPTALWELGCEARRFSAVCVPGEVLIESAKACYLYNPANCPEATLEWLRTHPIPALRLEGASHWPSLDQPHLVARSILEALTLLGQSG